LLQKITFGESSLFSRTVNVQIRSKDDPYMIFTENKNSLGSDFTIFKYLAFLTFGISGLALLCTCGHFIFVLEKFDNI